MRRYKDIILYRAYAGIKSEGRQNYLGYLWYLLEPALSTVVLYVAFTQVTGKGGAEWAYFIILGLMAWQWFESSVMIGSAAIKAKFGVLNQYDLPKYIFPVVSILVNSWKCLCVFVVVLLAGMALGFGPNPNFAYLPLVYLLQLMLITGITLPLSIGATLSNDLMTVVASVFRLLFFLSGIFYHIDAVPENLRGVFFMNPMAVFIDSYREVIIHNRAPDTRLLLQAGATGAAFFAIGALVHLRYDKKLMKLINA